MAALLSGWSAATLNSLGLRLWSGGGCSNLAAAAAASSRREEIGGFAAQARAHVGARLVEGSRQEDNTRGLGGGRGHRAASYWLHGWTGGAAPSPGGEEAGGAATFSLSVSTRPSDGIKLAMPSTTGYATLSSSQTSSHAAALYLRGSPMADAISHSQSSTTGLTSLRIQDYSGALR